MRQFSARNDWVLPDRPSSAEQPNPTCGARKPVFPSSISCISSFHAMKHELRLLPCCLYFHRVQMVSQPNAQRNREQCRVCLPRRGKDTGRSDKKILDTMDLQVRINNTLRGIYAHARGAGLMIPVRRL